MANHPAFSPGTHIRTPMSLEAVRQDLKHKQELISAACRCLNDEHAYRFFCHLASLSGRSEEHKTEILAQLDALGKYHKQELGAIRRLVMSDGASAFKALVDLVRDIRVEQEIEAMVQ